MSPRDLMNPCGCSDDSQGCAYTLAARRKTKAGLGCDIPHNSLLQQASPQVVQSFLFCINKYLVLLYHLSDDFLPYILSEFLGTISF